MKRKRDIAHFFGKSGTTTGEKSDIHEEQNPDVEVRSEDESRVRTGTEGAHDESTIPGPAGNVLLLNWMCLLR